MPLFLTAGVFRVQFVCMKTPLEEALVSGRIAEKQECVLTGTVCQAIPGKGYARLVVTDTVITCAGEEIRGAGKIMAYVPERSLAAPGSCVRMTGKVQSFARGENPGQYDEYEYGKAQGIGARFQAASVEVLGKKGYFFSGQLWKLRQQLRKIYERLLPEEEAGILDAMLLAEKGMLSEETKDQYRKAGISHILAVSGLHFTLLGMLMFRGLKQAGAGFWISTGVSVLLVVLYGCLTGFGISVTRAVIMLSLSLLSGVFGRTYDAASALAFAALVILWRQPLQLFQAGFLMSFGAVAGILLLGPVFERMQLKFLGGSLAVQVVLTPILLWFYYEIPVYSIVLNLIILPFMSLVLVSGLAAGIVGSISLIPGRFLAGSTFFLLKGYELICRINEALPLNTWLTGRPEGWQLLLYYMGVLIFYLCCRRSRRKSSLFWLGALLLVFAVRDRELSVTFLSVGQGDCAVIQQGSMTLVMDAGSSVKNGADKILSPYLRYHGDNHIEYLFLSHTDSDHYSMLKEVLEKMIADSSDIFIETIVMSSAGSEEQSYQMLLDLAEEAEVPILFMSAGDMIRFEELKLHCLYPDKNCGVVADTNEASLILALETNQSLYLFTGDASAAGERAAIKKWKELPAAAGALKTENTGESGSKVYLKAAHHGSRYSSSQELLALLPGGTAVLSCGKGNSYGHPHTETLERMEAENIQTYITWQTGAVRIREKTGEVELWLEGGFQ